MPHGKSHSGHGSGHQTGDISLMSLFINMIVDLIVNRKVNKAANAIKNDPIAQNALKDMNSAADKVKQRFNKWCEENPEECKKLQDDPVLGKYYTNN